MMAKYLAVSSNSTFDVGILGRFLKNLRELIVLENLSVGRTGELAEFVVFEQALQQISDDYPVCFREVALILRVDRLNDLVEQAFGSSGSAVGLISGKGNATCFCSRTMVPSKVFSSL